MNEIENTYLTNSENNFRVVTHWYRSNETLLEYYWEFDNMSEADKFLDNFLMTEKK